MFAAARSPLPIAVFVLAGAAAAAGQAPDIFTAARLGDVARVAELMDAAPELVAARTPHGETPLHLAAAGREPALVELLVARGADVNAADGLGRRPLHVAAVSYHKHVFDALLAHGADVHAADGAGDQPLHAAARRFRAGAVAALLAAGADPMAENAAGQTPLHVLGGAVRVRDEGFLRLLEALAGELIAAGADPAIVAGGFPALASPVAEGTEPPVRDTWPTYAEIGPLLLSYEATYPGLCRRYDLGLSHEGRHLWAMKISDNVDVEEDEPEFKYISTMHGNEIVGVKMCLNLIDTLLTGYGTDPQVTNLVDEVEIWIVPLMNPDGYDRSPRTRTNAQGIDLNRSFPDPYTSPNNTPAGRATETQVIMNWSFAHSFTLSANFHGGALVVNYPFDNNASGSSVYTPTPDDDLFIWVSEQYSQHNLPMWNSPSFYHGITNGADWYAISGGMQDWNYHYMGNNEVTIELGTTKEPPASTIPTYWNDNRAAMLAYMEACLVGVRGRVYDAQTGAPLAATVTVVGRSHDVYTDPDVGDYHRMLRPGSYQLRFAAAGYETLTLPVTVAAGPATRLDVPMGPSARVTYPNGGETLTAGQPVDVTWIGNPTASFQVQYSANYGEADVVGDDFESGVLGPEYTMGGSAAWFVTAAGPHGGSYAARSGVITHGQSSALLRTTPVPGELSFWYRVSSESGFDWFNFYVDGVRKVHVSGEVPWTRYVTTLAGGTHVLKWEYTKDYSQSSGSDAAWIDDFELRDDQTAWTDIAAQTPPGATATPWTPPAAGDRYKVRVRADYGGSYGPWDESDDVFRVSEPGYPPGDLDCNGRIDFADIDPLVVALAGQGPYEAAYPDCIWLNADCNGDGRVDFADIDAFVALLAGP